MYEFCASRAILIKYFEKNDELYHSAVYEVCDKEENISFHIVGKAFVFDDLKSDCLPYYRLISIYAPGAFCHSHLPSQ